MAARVLIPKLFKICSEEDSIGCYIFSKLAERDLQSLRIVQECRSLEHRLDCDGVTDTVLNSETTPKQVKKHILKVDWETCVSRASQHSSTIIAAQISSSASGLKPWDIALDHGPQGTSALQALYRMITKPKTGQNCSICDSVVEDTYFEHYTTNHTPISNPELVIDCLAKESTKVFDYARHFL